VDAVLCDVQASANENQACRICSLQMRVGVVTDVAKIIEYYVPERFRKKTGWTPPDQRGKVIPFPVPQKKSA
jgi:hypothetical protein